MPQDQLYVQAEIELNNTFDVQPISEISISQRVDWHHTFEMKVSLEVIEGQRAHNLEKTQDYIGKSIKIALKDQQGETQYNLFKGIVTEISLARYGGAATDAIIRGYSPTILLDSGPNCTSFLEKTLKQIVGDITGAYPVNFLKASVKPSSNPTINFAAQYNESDFNFIGRLANMYGQWFFYNGTELCFGTLPATGTTKLFFGHDLVSFHSSMRLTPLRFEAIGSDYVQNTFLSSPSSSLNVSGLDNFGRRALQSSDSLYSSTPKYYASRLTGDQSQLDEISKIRKAALAAELVVFNGTSYNPKLAIGGKIQISGAAIASKGENMTDYGTYTIIAVTHYIDGRGGYQNNFEAIPATLSVPQRNAQIKEPMCDTQPAIVTDNKDPEGYGRVKVNFPWQKQGDSTQWIRLTNQYAGAGRGFYILPEIGDEVLVGFENNNPSFPFVIGSYYNGVSNSNDKKDADNFVKSLRTKSGNEILIYDKAGEEAIHIFTKDQKNEVLITAKDDGLIRITSNKKIMIEAKNDMEVKAENITVSATDTLEMKAKEFKVSADSLAKIESSQDFEMKGMDVKMEADNSLKMAANSSAELTSNATVEISGNAKTTVKATGQLELSAAAQASLKGGVVMIN